MKADNDILENLGRLPPQLADLYQTVYAGIMEYPTDTGRQLISNVFTWLLCARTPLKSDVFMRVATVNLKKHRGNINRQQVLDFCPECELTYNAVHVKFNTLILYSANSCALRRWS